MADVQEWFEYGVVLSGATKPAWVYSEDELAYAPEKAARYADEDAQAIPGATVKLRKITVTTHEWVDSILSD